MKSRYHYIIFTFLGLLTFTALYLSYRYVGNPQTSNAPTAQVDVLDDTTYMLDTPYSKETWLAQIEHKFDQRSYFYAVSQMQIKLN